MKDFNMTGEKLEYTSGERSFVNYDKNGIAKEKKTLILVFGILS